MVVMQERYFTNHRFNPRENVFLFFRLTVLESTVENKDQQYAELNQKYLRLSEDFKYNLKLIDDRDKELATFDNRYKGYSSSAQFFLFFSTPKNLV